MPDAVMPAQPIPPRQPRRAAGPERALPWPLPALLAWSAAWALCWAALQAGLAPAGALAVGALAGVVLAWRQVRPWRRALAAGGFPLSALALAGAAGWPAWVWLAALMPLLLAYPLRAWRDAPFYPTPATALRGLDALVAPAPRRVLEAGCGLGHGLRALRALWPQARLDGIEWSLPLAWWAAWRCREAAVRRGDMWAADWRGYDLVYLFQRPESMARAWDKARREMAPGAWLVSLEFEVPGVAAVQRLQPAGQRPLWLYRLPPATAQGGSAQPARAPADNPAMSRQHAPFGTASAGPWKPCS